MDFKLPHFSRIFFGLSSFQILAMFRRGLFYTYLSIYLRYFLGLSVTETTLFATIPMILNVCFQTFVWGIVSDKYQLRRTLIITGEIFAGIGIIVVWYSHTLVDNQTIAGYIIILGLSLVEIFWSMSNVGWSALISDVYPSQERSRVQGQLGSVGGLGRIFGVWIGGLLYDGFQLKYEGWGFYEGYLFFVASLMMFLSVIPMLFVPEGGIKEEQIKLESHPTPLVAGKENQTTIFVVFLIGMTFINFGRNSIATILPQYLVLDSGFGMSSELLSYVINMQSIGIVLVGLTLGVISRYISHGNTVLLGSTLAVLSLVLLTVINLPIVFLASFLRGSSQIIILASSYAFASVLIPSRHRGKLFAVFNATFFLSWGISGTFMAGPITDFLIFKGVTEVQAYQAALLVGALTTFMGLLIQAGLMLKLKRSNNDHQKNV